MKAILYVFLFSYLFFGCVNNNPTGATYAYFGGEIINPNNNYITLRAINQEVADTLYIDANNRFQYHIKNLNPGLYFFMHGGEYQMLLLEPQDSIMARLNTFDFDESLVYTGNGAKKNNWLIKSFLENEKKARKLSDYFKMTPDTFHEFIEANRVAEHSKLDNYLLTNNESEAFKTLAKAQIDYGHYTIKEIYPFGYYGNNKIVQIRELPENFYAYRSEVNFNAEELADVYVYNRFLFSFFDNIAVEEYYKHHECHQPFDRQSLLHSLSKLRLIDSVVSSPTIKNDLLKFTVQNFINVSNDQNEINSLFSDYIKRSDNTSFNEELKNQVEVISKMQPGQQLFNVEVINSDKKSLYLNTIVNNPTVIYFWSSNFRRHYHNSHKRASYLKETYPEVNFIAINLNTDNLNYWEQTLENSKYNQSNEFKFKDLTNARKVMGINSIDKVILVDKDFTIIHPNLRLFSSEIETYLAQASKLGTKKRP